MTTEEELYFRNLHLTDCGWLATMYNDKQRSLVSVAINLSSVVKRMWYQRFMYAELHAYRDEAYTGIKDYHNLHDLNTVMARCLMGLFDDQRKEAFTGP